LLVPKRTSLHQRLVKTGGRLVKHARYYWLLLAEGHLTRRRCGADGRTARRARRGPSAFDRRYAKATSPGATGCSAGATSWPAYGSPAPGAAATRRSCGGGGPPGAVPSTGSCACRWSTGAATSCRTRSSASWCPPPSARTTPAGCWAAPPDRPTGGRRGHPSPPGTARRTPSQVSGAARSGGSRRAIVGMTPL